MAYEIATDVLVIGAGAAAARAAVEASAEGVRVDLVDKGEFGSSGSSAGMLSGFAALFNKDDSPELFFEDWIKSGESICDQNLVWEAITQSREAVLGLESMGLEFIENNEGGRNLYQGAGHSLARGLTAKTENVLSVLRSESERKGVHIHEGIMITRLLTRNGRAIGATGISRDLKSFVFNAKAVILAGGGVNCLYSAIAPDLAEPGYQTTGDALVLAFEAGAPLIDMEFTQFRESPPGASRFGGKYLNKNGERFMEKYHPRSLEKAPRAKVVAAIYREEQGGRGPVVWKVEGIRNTESDLTFAQRYGSRKEVEIRLDFQRLLGGVPINERAETPVPGLFAAGESSGGIHGAGRMQGDAFLETQVFGSNAGRNAAGLARNTTREAIDPLECEAEAARTRRFNGDVDPRELIRTVQETMWSEVGVVRDRIGISRAISRFQELRREMLPKLSGTEPFTALEAKNLLLTAEMVAAAALAREETRGCHIRGDYPDTHESWRKHISLVNRGGEISVATLPVSAKNMVA